MKTWFAVHPAKTYNPETIRNMTIRKHAGVAQLVEQRTRNA